MKQGRSDIIQLIRHRLSRSHESCLAMSLLTTDAARSAAEVVVVARAADPEVARRLPVVPANATSGTEVTQPHEHGEAQRVNSEEGSVNDD
jgi:hypothetical protein